MVGLWALMAAADSYWNVQLWRITCTWSPTPSWGEHVHATPTSHVTGERCHLPWTSTGSRRPLREIWHCEGTSMIMLPSPCPLLVFALLHVTFLCPQGREQPSHHDCHHCCLGTWLSSGLVLFSIPLCSLPFSLCFSCTLSLDSPTLSPRGTQQQSCLVPCFPCRMSGSASLRKTGIASNSPHWL